MKTRKTSSPTILPREPLTRKARAAIEKYAVLKGGELPLTHYMVGYVLEAERMRRVALYAWLENKGYRWFPDRGFWQKPEQK